MLSVPLNFNLFLELFQLLEKEEERTATKTNTLVILSAWRLLWALNYLYTRVKGVAHSHLSYLLPICSSHPLSPYHSHFWILNSNQVLFLLPWIPLWLGCCTSPSGMMVPAPKIHFYSYLPLLPLVPFIHVRALLRSYKNMLLYLPVTFTSSPTECLTHTHAHALDIISTTCTTSSITTPTANKKCSKHYVYPRPRS